MRAILSRVRLHGAAGRGRLWVTAIAWAMLVIFAFVSVGAPLLGDGTFLGTQLLTSYAPWSSTLHSTVPITNPLVGDTVNSATPQVALIVDAARHGVFGQWNPFLGGGTQLAGLPNSGIYSPLSLPWWFLPLTYAPGVVKVLEIAVATVGTSLFLRRLRLPSATWALASLIFVSSGFMIAWTNWPQTRVAAFIPFLFWAVDRAAVRRRLVDAIPVGIVLACLLLGGFPEVTGFAVYAAGAYAVFRAITDSRRFRPTCAAVGVNIAGLALGILLSAWQMVPFAANAASFIDFAARSSAAYTASSWSTLATALVPTLGATDPIEQFTYMGAATIALFVAAALIRPRADAPRRGLVFFAIMLALCIVIVFAGSPIVNVFQRLPVFSDNPVGRLRCIIGFAAAVVAAFGFARVLDPLRHADWVRPAGAPPAHARVRSVTRIAVVAVIAAASVAVVAYAFHGLPASGQRRTALEILATLVLGVAATGLVVIVWLTGGRRAILVAACLIPVLVVAPALYVTHSWWPKSELSTFYPQTATHRYLEKHLGDQRYATVGFTMLPGSNSYYQLRTLGGHTFQTAQWKALQLKADPNSFASPTYSTLSQADLPESITSPILDRLGVKYVVDAPDAPVVGTAQAAPAETSVAEVRSGGSVTSPVFAGPVRGLSFRVPGTSATESDGVWLTTTLRNAVTGATMASTRTWYASLSGVRNVALDGGSISDSESWTATITMTGQNTPVPVAENAGRASVGVVRPADDGLRIVHTGDATVYLRTTALNRVRWASSAVVETTAAARIDLLDSSTLSKSAVVLDSRADLDPSDADSTATVRQLGGTLNEVRVSVTSSGAGWVVVDDSLRAPGWTATVDGAPARLVTADEAGGAVHVTAGHHTIVLRYQTPGLSVGIVLSLATLVGLGAAGLVTVVRRRRARRTTPRRAE